MQKNCKKKITQFYSDLLNSNQGTDNLRSLVSKGPNNARGLPGATHRTWRQLGKLEPIYTTPSSRCPWCRCKCRLTRCQTASEKLGLSRPMPPHIEPVTTRACGHRRGPHTESKRGRLLRAAYGIQCALEQQTVATGGTEAGQEAPETRRRRQHLLSWQRCAGLLQNLDRL